MVEELCSRMVAQGHNVTCYNRGGHHVSGSEYDSKRLKEYKGIRLKTVPTIEKKGLAAVSSSFFAALCCAFGRYDIVHIHAEGPAFFAWLPKLFGKKVIVTIHGLDWQREKWKSGFGSKFIHQGEKNAVKYADEIIVLSKGVQDYFVKEYGRKTVFIPNGVNRPKIQEAELITEKYGLEKDSYILFLGRLVPEKGIRYLVEAFKNVKTDKKLVIAGGSSDTDSFMNELKDLAKDDDRIIFTGFVQGQILKELYSNAYVYTLPSDLEGMQLSLLEAMSYGNCCLVSNIQECAEVVEDRALIFKKSDVEDLREKLQEACDHPEMVMKMKNQAADFICAKYNSLLFIKNEKINKFRRKMTMGKYFGTDGFRGEAGITLTADHAYKVGRFLGWYYNALRERNGNIDPARIVIGKDTRRSSYMFEYSLVAGLTASGADAYLLHVTTTPSVAYIACVDDFDCGIMISASHNPYYDNGIKLIDCYGEKMPEETLLLVEDYIDGKLHMFDKDWPELPFAHREHIGCTVDYVAGRNRYMGYLISLGIYSFKGVKVGLDCANGSSWNIAKSVFDALGADTHVINNKPNGTNINTNAGSTHIEGLQKFVVEKGLDVGFAYDGDADRCLCVDEKGNVITGDHILYIYGCYMKERGKTLYPFSQITLTTSSTYFWQVSWSGASTITRTTGSVPDPRARIRPVSPSASATLLTASCTAGSFCAAFLSVTRTFSSTCG